MQRPSTINFKDILDLIIFTSIEGEGRGPKSDRLHFNAHSPLFVSHLTPFLPFYYQLYYQLYYQP